MSQLPEETTSSAAKDALLCLMVSGQTNAKKVDTRPRAKYSKMLLASTIAFAAILVATLVLYFTIPEHRLLIGVAGGIAASIFSVWLIPKWQVASLNLERPSDRFASENEARKTTAQVLGGLAFLIGFYFTAQNLAFTQDSAEKTRELTRLGQLNERLARAHEQLVSKDSVESPILGSYALGQIALESPEKSKVVTHALAAYIRLNSPWKETGNLRSPLDRSDVVISPGIEAALFQLRELSRKGAFDPDQKKAAIFKDALSNLNLSHTDLRGADLTSMWLEGAALDGAHLNNANLDSTVLNNATLIEADLSGVDLSSTYLVQALLNTANLRDATLSEKTGLTQTQIDDACFGEEDTFPPSLSLRLPQVKNPDCQIWNTDRRKKTNNERKTP